MNRRLAAILALLLLTGCSAPPKEPAPEPKPTPPSVERPRPEASASFPAGAPVVAKAHGGTLVKGVREPYLWYADGRRLAVTSETGLWSVAPDGEALELLARDGPPRQLVGPYGDGVLFLEQHPGAIVAFLARPGQPPRQVAAVEHPGVEQSGYPFWGAVAGSRLIVAIEGRRCAAIDLTSGEVNDLGDEAIPVARGELALSPSQKELAYKQVDRGDSVRILDLESGAVRRPGDAAHMAGVTWSPAGDRWAVRAAEPGSGLSADTGVNLVEGGTRLDLGDGKGGLRHLTPPWPMELVAGPWWSSDSRYLAVVQGSSQPDSGVRERLWVVDMATGDWRRLATLPEGSRVTGFHPVLPAVMVQSERGLLLWPANGDDPTEVAIPWAPGEAVRLSGDRLLFLSAEPKPKLYLNQELLLAEGSPKGRLTAQGTHAALILYRDGLRQDLLLLPLPR